jgi:hypothetical protein
MKIELTKKNIAIAIGVLLLIAVVLYFYFREDDTDKLLKQAEEDSNSHNHNPGGGTGGAQSSGQTKPPATSTSEIKIGDAVKAKYDGMKVWKDDFDNGKTTELAFYTKKGEILGKVYKIKDSYLQVFYGSRGGWIFYQNAEKI